MTNPSVGVVVLTRGGRDDDLARAIESVRSQQGVDIDLVCVVNGPREVPVPDGVRCVPLGENLGIPEGRNCGAALVTGEWIAFLDDDASLTGTDFLARAIGIMTTRPEIGIIQPRVSARGRQASPTRWIPRIRKGNPSRSSAVMALWEGALVARRSTYDEAGGWGGCYFYAHEGIELAWRIWNTGKIAWYEGSLAAEHPFMTPERHAEYYRLNARNRVWLAKRNLPVRYGVLYVGAWAAVQIMRSLRSRGRGLGAWLRGLIEGMRTNPGGRAVLTRDTLKRMREAGRPPVI